MKTLTLFAGAGGADCGMRDAGAEHVRCIEYDESAAATLKAAGFPAVVGDVRDLALYADLPPIDLMWASPPCQDWSSAGRREGSTGERNGWPWTWDAIDHLRERGIGPDWFIAENVPGMLTHTSAHCGKGCCSDPDRCARTYFLEVLLAEAKKRFSSVTWRVLDAADFGIPQFRRRIFLVCGDRPIRWPTPTHGEPTTQTGLFGPGLLPWVTVRAALGLEGVFGGGKRGHGMAEWEPADLDERPAATVNAMFVSTAAMYVRTEATGAVATPDTEPAPTVPTKGNQYLHAADPGVRVSKAASQPGRLDRPADTLSAGSQSGHPNGRSIVSASQKAREGLLGEMGRRRLTVAECARLQDFPSDYPWQGTKTSQYRQVGNGVCARVARVLTSSVMEAHSAIQEDQR